MRAIPASLFLIGLFGHSVTAGSGKTELKGSSFSFYENKGQVVDQYNQPRPDILFTASDQEFNLQLKKTGYSYQISDVVEWQEVNGVRDNEKIKLPVKTKYHRIDVSWLNSNPSPQFIAEDQNVGYTNYYTRDILEGVRDVYSYHSVLVRNIYNKTDLKWFVKDKQYKYEFVLQPGADPELIQMKIEGANQLYINQKGELVIETSLGKIIEEAPLVYQNDQLIKSSWKLTGNIASYTISNYDRSKPLLIDPGVRVWGTYYGGDGGDSGMNTYFDVSGNVYLIGTTNSSTGNVIATSGSHQDTYGGGVDNGYIVKFNAGGVRQWSTYYGGPNRELGFGMAVDNNGNAYMIGHSLGSPGNIISTPGTYQTSYAGVWDAFVVKFDANGIRQWGTYYGSATFEQGNAIAVDNSGNVFICGKTDAATTTVIATPGSHQPNFGGVEDAFLVKLNSSGQRVWATYYGGTGVEAGRGLCVDPQGNVYMTGWTDNSVPNVIGTPGCHQNTFGGGSLDAFIVKFDPSGVRIWGTQYGGSGTDMAYDCEVDATGNVYMVGKTSSTQSISTAGSHQPAFGGGPQDAFIASFDPNGVRNWGSYYGGTGDEEGWGCAVHKTGHIYLAGFTSSTGGTAIATPGSHQTVYGGGTWDGFIAQFHPSGSRMWGSYYGETGSDVIYGCSTDNFYNVSIAGCTDTNSGTAIASSGSHQPNYGTGFGDGFLAKFYDCPAPIEPTSSTSTTNLSFCEGQSTTLTVVSTNSVNWYASPTSTSVLGSGTVYITPVLSAGTYTYYAESVSCTVSINRTPVTVTVFAKPNLSIIANPTLVCAGKNSTLTASGANTYTWSGGSATTAVIIESPASTTVYTVTGTSTAGCVSNKTISITVYPLDPVTLSASTYTSCITITGGGLITLTGTPAGGIYSGSNLAGNQLNPSALGIFTPVYTYTNPTNGCVNSATTSIEVFDCTSIEEFNLNSFFSVSPNPTNDVIVIRSLNDKEKKIVLSDATGRILKQNLVKETETTIDLSQYSNGIYFVSITYNQYTHHYKIIKQ